MKIALVSCVYPPYKSGIGNMAARHARQLTDMGHQVTVFCPAHDDEAGRDIVDGIAVERIRALVRHGNSAFVPQLAWRMKGFDAVYIMWPFFGGAESAAIGARVNRTPYIIFFHMDGAVRIGDGHRVCLGGHGALDGDANAQGACTPGIDPHGGGRQRLAPALKRLRVW